jgi:RHS repeat-associated protein
VTRTEPGPVTTQIVFDGGLSIIEFTSTASSPTVEYIRGYNYGGGVGGLEYSIRSGTPSFNFYDSRGDVTTKTNASGTVTYQTSYEAFGNQTVSTGTTPLDRQRASTKEQDPTGLLNEGFRYRDPSTGTFLSRDPIGFKAGLNNYSYVHQNPWTKFDPEGLSDDTKKKLAPVHLTGYAEILSEIEHGTILDTARKTVEKDAIHAAYDKAADTGNYLSHGDWARKTEDKSMTAYQLGYQFVKGTGSDSHKFDTSSHMGQEMMNSDYVKAAVLKATEQGMHGNFSPVKAKRQIGEGLVTPVQKLAGDVNFVSGFMNDFFTNPARALQGSISGQAVPVVRKVGNNRVLYVVVQLFDDLGAASATHLPISASQHYGTSILQNNPYGPGGPMRTIHVEYDLQTQPIVLGPANQHLAPPSR